ncbi:MAG: hypothetical protein ACUVRM_04950 [Bacillota bacterium]
MGYGPDTNVDGRDLARIIRKARRLAAEAYEKAGATMDRFTAEIRENGYTLAVNEVGNGKIQKIPKP